MTAISPKEQQEKLKRNERKWTKPLMDAGWTVIPNVLIERQRALGLDSLDFNILLVLASMWWDAENPPWPSKKFIASIVGVSARTVQRRISKLVAGGLMEREARTRPDKGQVSNRYHFTKLITEATPYALEEIQRREQKARETAEKVRRKRPSLALVK